MARNVCALIGAAVICLSLAGCGPVIQSNVQSFSQLGDRFSGKTIAVVPIDDVQRDSLEFNRYVSVLKSQLAAKGFKPIDNNSATAPDYVAFFDFGIDNGQRVSSTYSTPIWGQTGVSSSYTSGTMSLYGNSGSYSGYTTYTPTYGITGYAPTTVTGTVYSRVVTLDILQPDASGKLQKAYEAKLTSQGSCGKLAAVMDEFMTALFRDFPGEASTTIEVPMQGDC